MVSVTVVHGVGGVVVYFLHVALSEVVSEQRNRTCQLLSCVRAARPHPTGVSAAGRFTSSSRVESRENGKINYGEINKLSVLDI